RVTVTVRIRPPDKGPGKKEIGLFPAVGGFDTIIVDRDGSEAQRRRVNGDSATQSDIVVPRSATTSSGSTTTFTFDKVFWSMFAGSKDQERQGSCGRYPAPYTTQNNVFEAIGRDVVDKCLSGYNTCLFAYGQTGSGKTFTMMGGADPSATPAAVANATPSTSGTSLAAPGIPTSSSAPISPISPQSASPPSSPSSSSRATDRENASSNAHETEKGSGEATDGLPPTAEKLSPVLGAGVGSGAQRGVIPRICQYIFERAAVATAGVRQAMPDGDRAVASGADAASIGRKESSAVGGKDSSSQQGNTMSTTWSFSVSFTEIYMEKVRDLLDTSGRPNQNLKVREHPTKGPFVEGVLNKPVSTASETERLLVEGQARRVVAGTNMNEASSRSHAIFTIVATKTDYDKETGAEGLTVSKVNLVDLAGSENSNSAGSAGTRLKEGASINRSLLTLGRVIKALADASDEVQ
ncbi:unnamed protein product, partial [Sphacelaria rigidula]